MAKLTMRGKLVLAGVLILGLVGGSAAVFGSSGDTGSPNTSPEKAAEEARRVAAAENDPGCDIEPSILEPVWRGYRRYRSGDVLAIERLPNQFGTRHSSPHPYTQNVPVALYGPGFVKQGVVIDRPITVADLAPTFAELLGFDGFPQRAGKVLEDALLPEAERNGVPKLLFTLVWDGGGDNVLDQWPKAWPNLATLKEKGVWYENATVGSSPSITPSIHATIGTGAFPKKHGLPDIKIRAAGRIVDSWEGGSPRYLEVPTLGDLWDAANDNEPLIGTLARDHWHLGMLGHGDFRRGGDKDIAVLDSFEGVFFRDEVQHFRTPDYLKGTADLSDEYAAVDAADGRSDGKWLDNEISPRDPQIRYTPAWPPYQTDRLIELLRREGFGRDRTPDIFYTNYKGSDLAGHEWNMIDKEVRDVVRAQDRQIPRLIRALDELVGPRNYVLAHTADHGMTPRPEATGGWSINTAELSSDLDRAFNPDRSKGSIVMSQRGYQVMLDRKRMKEVGVTDEEVAAFIRNYKIKDNVTDSNREVFESRFMDKAEEKLYLTALTPAQLKSAATGGCAPA